jgi:hypothetical protein
MHEKLLGFGHMHKDNIYFGVFGKRELIYFFYFSKRIKFF